MGQHHGLHKQATAASACGKSWHSFSAKLLHRVAGTRQPAHPTFAWLSSSTQLTYRPQAPSDFIHPWISRSLLDSLLGAQPCLPAYHAAQQLGQVPARALVDQAGMPCLQRHLVHQLLNGAVHLLQGTPCTCMLSVSTQQAACHKVLHTLQDAGICDCAATSVQNSKRSTDTAMKWAAHACCLYACVSLGQCTLPALLCIRNAHTLTALPIPSAYVWAYSQL